MNLVSLVLHILVNTLKGRGCANYTVKSERENCYKICALIYHK